jgi:hypothetical protein
MSNKPNCTAKPRHRHCTLKLLVLQHLRYLLRVLVLPQQVQQPHSYNPSHGGLRSYCLSAVHLHHSPTATNTVNVAASGPLFHLYFVPVSLSLCFSAHHQFYFLVARLVQFLKCDIVNCSEWRMVCFACFPLFSHSGLESTIATTVIREWHHGRETECLSYTRPIKDLLSAVW